MCIAQVGQAAPSAWHTILAPRGLTDAEVELCFSCGHIGVVGVVELGPKAVAKGVELGVVENWVPDAETAFLVGGLCSEPSTISDGHWDESQCLREVCIR